MYSYQKRFFNDCIELVAHASNDKECEVYSRLGEAFIISTHYVEIMENYKSQFATLKKEAKKILEDAKDEESLIHLIDLASGYIASSNKIIYYAETEIGYLDTIYQKQYESYLNPTEVTSKKVAERICELYKGMLR